MKLRWLLAPAVALALTGCFKEKTLVVVNPDGSGNIVISSAMSPEAAQMLGSMAEGLTGALAGEGGAGAKTEAKPKVDPFFNEEELKAKAAKLGEGVTYEKGRKTSENGWQGSMAVYAFSDINKVRIPMNEEKKMGPGAGAAPAADANEPAKPKKFVTFAMTGGDTKTLQIKVPQDEAKPAAAKADAPAKDPQEAAMAKAMMAPMLKMMQGLEMGIAVQVKGEVLESNASQRAADGRFVLVHMDMDKLQTSPKFAGILEASDGPEEMPTGELLGLPGFQYETNNVVNIRFK